MSQHLLHLKFSRQVSFPKPVQQSYSVTNKKEQVKLIYETHSQFNVT